MPSRMARTRPRVSIEPPSAGSGAPSSSASQESGAASGAAREMPDAVDDIGVVVLGHAIVQRNGHAVAFAVARPRQVVGPIAEALTVVAEHVDGVGARPRRDAE